MKQKLWVCLCAATLLAVPASANVFPTAAHAAFNYIPFANGACTMHQVFDANLFANAMPPGYLAKIESIAFAPNTTLAGQQIAQPVQINLGYTNRVGGQASPAGLSTPVAGGGGAPNAIGAMTTFFNDPNYSYTVVSGGANNFEMKFTGTPFIYDPSQGNLLFEIVTPATQAVFSVSRCAGSAEGSRSYIGGTWTGESPTTATRMDIVFTPVPEPTSLLLLGAAVLLRRR